MYIFTPRLRALTIFVLIYFVIYASIAVTVQNYEFMLYQLQMIFLFAIVVFMDKRVQFSQMVLWMLGLWGFFHLSGGLIPIPDSIADMNDADPGDKVQVLYNMRLSPYFPRYDQIVHAFGFGTCALTAKEALQAHLGKPIHINWPMGSAIFLIALGLGCINEIIEFALTISLPDTNVGGYINTGWDMVSNAVGALIAVFYMKFMHKA